jgi:hypothetical protein
MDSRLVSFGSGLFALGLLAGCAADVNSPIEGASRSGGQLDIESRSEESGRKSSSQTTPPSITYRPGP